MCCVFSRTVHENLSCLCVCVFFLCCVCVCVCFNAMQRSCSFVQIDKVVKAHSGCVSERGRKRRRVKEVELSRIGVENTASAFFLTAMHRPCSISPPPPPSLFFVQNHLATAGAFQHPTTQSSRQPIMSRNNVNSKTSGRVTRNGVDLGAVV